VTVLVVDHLGIAAVELECRPAVPADPDRPSTLRRAFETVQAIARDIHVFDCLSRIEGGRLQAKSFGVFRLDARCLSVLKEPLQSLVAKGLDHWFSVAWCASRNNSPASELGALPLLVNIGGLLNQLND
jgi:hypothetical protein